jgi:hypothetical protein
MTHSCRLSVRNSTDSAGDATNVRPSSHSAAGRVPRQDRFKVGKPCESPTDQPSTRSRILGAELGGLPAPPLTSNREAATKYSSTSRSSLTCCNFRSDTIASKVPSGSSASVSAEPTMRSTGQAPFRSGLGRRPGSIPARRQAQRLKRIWSRCEQRFCPGRNNVDEPVTNNATVESLEDMVSIILSAHHEFRRTSP